MVVKGSDGEDDEGGGRNVALRTGHKTPSSPPRRVCRDTLFLATPRHAAPFGRSSPAAPASAVAVLVWPLSGHSSGEPRSTRHLHLFGQLFACTHIDVHLQYSKRSTRDAPEQKTRHVHLQVASTSQRQHKHCMHACLYPCLLRHKP